MKVKRALGIAAVIVVPLSILEWIFALGEYPAVSAALFFLLFPGNFVLLLIAGGHGGTHMEDIVGVVLGTGVNITCYFILILGVAKHLERRSK